MNVKNLKQLEVDIFPAQSCHSNNLYVEYTKYTYVSTRVYHPPCSYTPVHTFPTPSEKCIMYMAELIKVLEGQLDRYVVHGTMLQATAKFTTGNPSPALKAPQFLFCFIPCFWLRARHDTCMKCWPNTICCVLMEYGGWYGQTM